MGSLWIFCFPLGAVNIRFGGYCSLPKRHGYVQLSGLFLVFIASAVGFRLTGLTFSAFRIPPLYLSNLRPFFRNTHSWRLGNPSLFRRLPSQTLYPQQTHPASLVHVCSPMARQNTSSLRSGKLWLRNPSRRLIDLLGKNLVDCFCCAGRNIYFGVYDYCFY